MEFQNNQQNNVPDKKIYDCDCGCGVTFLKGEGLGLRIKLILKDEDLIMAEDQIVNIDWNDYIPAERIKTWGDLLELIESSVDDYPNDRVWCHMEPYATGPDEFPVDTVLEFL
jgi:hypothetical protein